MPGVYVELSGNNELLAKTSNDGETLTNEPLHEYVDEASKLLVEIIQGNAPKDTRLLSQSFTRQVNDLTAEVSSILPYADVMNLGRTPGATMPPPQALSGWAFRHGFQPRNKKGQFMSTSSVLFVLARSIGRRGIAGTLYFDRSVQELEELHPELLARIGTAIEERWSAE